MRNVLITLLAVTSAFALGGCEVRVDDHWAHDPLLSAVSQSKIELDRHEIKLGEVVDISGADREIDRHDTAMNTHLAHVRNEIAILHCSYSERLSVSAAMQDVEARHDDYLFEVRNTPTLAAIAIACTEYVEDMNDLLDTLLDRAWDCYGW